MHAEMSDDARLRALIDRNREMVALSQAARAIARTTRSAITAPATERPFYREQTIPLRRSVRLAYCGDVARSAVGF